MIEIRFVYFFHCWDNYGKPNVNYNIQPCNIKIEERGGDFVVWHGSSCGETFTSYNDALKSITDTYDYVKLEFKQVITTLNVKQKIKGEAWKQKKESGK